LGDHGAFDEAKPEICQRENTSRLFAAVSQGDSCGGLDDDSAGGQLHGLGETPAAESGGQVSFAVESAEFLPACAIIDTAKFHDASKARDVCAGLEDGEIVIFDKAYVDFVHLAELMERGVYWVTRAKDNLQYKVIQRLQTTENPRILKDEIIELTVYKSRQAYPCRLRRVVALVEVDGKDEVLVFLTNQLTWSAWTVAELYRCRWDIEVFFKEIKQTLQLADFLGHNANAVRWQMWMGLLVHLLLRYLAFLSKWGHSFTRLFTVVRAVLWRYFNLIDLLDSYGTAKPPGRICGTPEQAYLPGFG